MISIYDAALFVDQERKFRGFQKLLQPNTRQAVMLIQATKDMGKTWLAGRMHDHCREQTINAPVAYVDFRNPREDNQDYLGLIRLLRDKLKHPSYFNTLNDTINSFSNVPTTAVTGLGRLRENIVASFNLSEIRSLCLDINVNYEELGGDTLSDKGRELIQFCQRRRILSQLITRCAELRSQIDWWDELEAYRDGDGETAVVETAIVVDYQTTIRVDNPIEARRIARQINDAFFEGLAALITDRSPVVLLFDSYEAAKPGADEWLRRELLPRLRDGQLRDLVIIINGRQTPDLSDLNMKPLLVQTSLEPLEEKYVREYFEERRRVDISGLDWRTIMLTSGGVPGAVAMMADHAMATAQDDDDFFSDL